MYHMFQEERAMKKIRSMTKFMAAVVLALVVATVSVPAVPVQAAKSTTKTIKAGGNTYYLVNREQNGRFRSRLYLKTSSGNKMVAGTSYSYSTMVYKFNYTNKLYFSYGADGIYNTYTYTIGRSGFYRARKGLDLVARYRNYGIGYTVQATDIGPDSLCLFRFKDNKVKNLGKGYDIRYFNNKVYYVLVSRNQKLAKVMRCNPDGTSKKTLRTIRSNYQMFNFRFKNAHKVTFTAITGSGSSGTRYATF